VFTDAQEKEEAQWWKNGWRRRGMVKPSSHRTAQGEPVKKIKLLNSQRGIALLETVMAIAILGLVAVAFLSGMATTINATVITEKQATADSLVRSEMEYVKNCAYQCDAGEYPVDPTLAIPGHWAMPPPTVEAIHATDDGIQKITVTAKYDGETILSVTMYKVDR